VTNHTFRGNHNTDSKIFYNDGNRFANPEIETIPTMGAHWSQNIDLGNIYDRSWKQTYESTVLQWRQIRENGNIEYVADVFDGTKIKFKVRLAATEKELADTEWIDVDVSGKFKLKASDRAMQYKAVMISENGDRYPILDRVSVSLAR
jgi:hypothetical protein